MNKMRKLIRIYMHNITHINCGFKLKTGFYCLRHIGFTLAEVLITLGIIGVVAALTIPSLIQNIQDAQYKTAYKKAFSVASQAIAKANSNYLFIESSYNNDHMVFKKNFIVFMNQFNVSKQCISDNNNECWATGGENAYGGYPLSTYYAFVDNSGMVWTMLDIDLDWTAVDTNGSKKPNQWGKDRFAIHLQDNTSGNAAVVHNLVLVPKRVKPFSDNPNGLLCLASNKCTTEHNYFGTSWLYK